MTQTAKTMALETVPEGTHAGEFLADEDLAAMYARELAALPADHPDRAAMAALARSSRRAAALTKATLAELAEADAAELEAGSATKVKTKAK